MKVDILKFIISITLLVLSYKVSARTYLVSVGIDDYSGFPAEISNLRLPTNDARTIVNLYSKNTSIEYSMLLNDQATKLRVLEAIKTVFNQAKGSDIVVFFFSGHGYPGGLCAYDNTIGYDEIRKAMSLSESKNIMMFVDACRSGGIRVDNKQSQNGVNVAKKASVMLFLSSRTNENSIECPDMQNGYFTTFLLKGLRGNADSDRNRVITAKELFDFVHKGVSKISDGRQHPVIWGNFNDNMHVIKW